MINALIKKKNITFSYILNNILHNSDHHFHGGIVSSRHFDAIANGSCNLLVEGSYQGLFEANKHYIKLNKDLSNYHQVVEMLKDFRLTEDIANRAYKHCLKYHTIKKRIAYLLKNI